jgi:hypothetical protein
VKHRRDKQLRISRVVLTLIGTLLLTFAAIGTLLATKRISHTGALDSHTPILNASGQQLFDNHQLAFQLGAVAVAVVLVTAGAMWVRNQIPPIAHQHDQPIANRNGELPGTNTVRGDALAHALAADLERPTFINRAQAEIRTDDNLIRLRLHVDDSAPLERILTSIEPAIDRVTHITHLEPRPHITTDLRLTQPPARRVY